MQGVVPMLAYEDAAAAIDWLTRAFGFQERSGVRMVGSDGRVSHAEMETGSGIIMLATPTPAYRGPRKHAESCEAARAWLSAPWVINGVLVYVKDIEGQRWMFMQAR